MDGTCPPRFSQMERHHLAGGTVVYVARTLCQRLLGLMGLAELTPGSALLIPGCDSVHTAWMRVPIDIVFLDAQGRPLEVRRAVPPWRVVRRAGAAAVLECPAGCADALGVSAPSGPSATPA